MGEVAQVCVEIFWHEKFIAPIPIPNLTSSLAPGSARDLELDLRGASSSTTLLSRLRSGR